MGRAHGTGISLAERVLGINDLADGHASLSRAYYRLTGEQVDPFKLITEGETILSSHAGKHDPEIYASGIELIERSVTINALKRICIDQDTGYVTFLKDWPVYEDLYTRYAQPPKSEKAKALMVGTLSALSSAAFAAFSEDVIKAKPFIIDPHPSPAKYRHGTFIKANGLALPGEWTNSMQAVVTSSLLSVLLGNDGKPTSGQPNERAARRTLFAQIYRTLAPNGSLLMTELPPGYDYADHKCETAYNQRLVATFADTLHHELDATGFTTITIGESWEFDGVDYIFDPSRQFHQYERIPMPRIRTVYAQKPNVS